MKYYNVQWVRFNGNLEDQTLSGTSFANAGSKGQQMYRDKWLMCYWPTEAVPI